MVQWCSWLRLGVGGALNVVLVARILGAVSSVMGDKVPVHFKVVVFKEYEKSSSLRRWMWRGPHTLIVHGDCAGVVLGASSYARLESWFDDYVCTA
jgi:hypothetical protein